MAKDSDLPDRLLNLGVTPIPRTPDVHQIMRSIEKISSAVNKSARHTERIPEIQKKVEVTREKVIELSTQFGHVDDRVNRVENKLEERHQCQKKSFIDGLKTVQKDSESRIETVVMDSVAQYAKIESLSKQAAETEADVGEIKKAPRKMVQALIGVMASIVIGAGGSVWFLAELSKDVEFERYRREGQIKQIEAQIKKQGQPQLEKVGRIHSRITQLEHTIGTVKELEQEYDNLCIEMNRSERKAMKAVLRRRGRKIPGSCLQ